MSLTRLTLCLGLLILLSGVSAYSRQEAPNLPPDAKWTGIPKGGAGIVDTENFVIVYDQGRGKGKIISKQESDEKGPTMHEFVIK